MRRVKTRYPGIYKTSHGTYEVFYRDTNGKQHTKSLARLQDAQAYQREVTRAVKRNEYVDPKKSKTTFAEWAEKYLDQKAIERRTRDKYQESLDNHLLPAFGGMQLASIDADTIQEWIVTMGRTEYRPGKTYGAETIRGHYALLVAILKRAVARGLISKNPCIDIELPKVVKKERRYLTEDQLHGLIQATPDRYRTLVIVGGYLGLRWQELAGLRRSSLKMAPGKVPTLTVASTIERSKGTYRVKEYGKSLAAKRTLKLPGFVAEALAWHLEAFPDPEWVFSAPKGGHLKYDNFRNRVWLPATEAAGLAPFNLHELRHTAAAFFIAEGANVLQVMRLMGHEDSRTTLETYGHAFEKDDDALVERLDVRGRRNPVEDLLGMDEAEVLQLPARPALKAV